MQSNRRPNNERPAPCPAEQLHLQQPSVDAAATINMHLPTPRTCPPAADAPPPPLAAVAADTDDGGVRPRTSAVSANSGAPAPTFCLAASFPCVSPSDRPGPAPAAPSETGRVSGVSPGGERGEPGREEEGAGGAGAGVALLPLLPSAAGAAAAAPPRLSAAAACSARADTRGDGDQGKGSGHVLGAGQGSRLKGAVGPCTKEAAGRKEASSVTKRHCMKLSKVWRTVAAAAASTSPPLLLLPPCTPTGDGSADVPAPVRAKGM